MANEMGYDRLMFCWIGFYACRNCKRFVRLDLPNIAKDEQGFAALSRVMGEIQSCPHCGKRSLYPWAPSCKCPRCNKKMESDRIEICVD